MNLANLTIQELEILDTLAQWLYFSSKEIDNITPKKQEYSNEFAHHNAKLNKLCLQKVSEWLREMDLKVSDNLAENAELWEFINGSVITIGTTKIVIIPSEDLDTEEIIIPQEWVELPELAGTYYLAVQVDWENNYLRIWGLMTHKTLKQEGEYDSFYRNYSLEQEQIIHDVEVLLLALELTNETSETLSPLPSLRLASEEELIKRLSQPSPYSPRLEVDFQQWQVLLVNPESRQKLYQQRLAAAHQQTITNISTTVQQTVVSLNEWFHDVFSAGWQTVEELVSNPQKLVAVYNIETRRAKLINIINNQVNTQVILVIRLCKIAEKKLEITVQVFSINETDNLPARLDLFILNEDEEVIYKTSSNSQLKKYLKARFKICYGDKFGLKLAINDSFFWQEKFMI